MSSRKKTYMSEPLEKGKLGTRIFKIVLISEFPEYFH